MIDLYYVTQLLVTAIKFASKMPRNHCNQGETKEHIDLKKRNRVTSETGKKPAQNSVFHGKTRNH